jgi:Aminotransferase class-III
VRTEWGYNVGDTLCHTTTDSQSAAAAHDTLDGDPIALVPCCSLTPCAGSTPRPCIITAFTSVWQQQKSAAAAPCMSHPPCCPLLYQVAAPGREHNTPRCATAALTHCVTLAAASHTHPQVQSGAGRTGAWWGHQLLGAMQPDMIIFAKGIASGYPIAGVASKPHLFENMQPGTMGGTYGGNAVACAAAVATIEVCSLMKSQDKCSCHMCSIAYPPTCLYSNKQISEAYKSSRGSGLVQHTPVAMYACCTYLPT